MDLIEQFLFALKNAALAKPIEFLGVATAIVGGTYLYVTGRIGSGIRYLMGKTTEAKPQGLNEAQLPYNPDNPVISLDVYETRLKKREDELRKNLETAHAEDKTLLQAQIDELTKQQSHPEDAFNAFKTKIAELEASLGNAETKDEQEAKAALEAGDLIKADEIFERIQTAQAINIKKAANAAFARGEIAEQQIRWKDAATHFKNAASLAPSYTTLTAARDLSWRFAQYNDAVHFGEALVGHARKEFDKSDPRVAMALNDHGTTLHTLGFFDEAESLFREALAIDISTFGKEHPSCVRDLNNIGGVLFAKGKHIEAESFYREAVEIGARTLGKDDPNYAKDLNNLAYLLKTTERFEEAEPLYQEALEVTRGALGEHHPDYANRINNLGELYRVTGRRDQAERSFLKSLEVTENSLGKNHPNYALALNNLGLFHQDAGRFNEAKKLLFEVKDILENALGPDHPDTKSAKQNLEKLLEDMSKSDG